jgi:biopolymer transport protein ExbB
MDIQERLTAFAMLGATWVMWLLVLLSIVALAIVLERVYYFVVTGDDLVRVKREMLALLGKGDVAGARKLLAGSKSFEARIADAGLAAPEDGAESAEERIEGEQDLARNNAPFLGLLGTVIGIIRSFAALNAAGGQVSPNLMAEIGEALVATAIGIMVALPAVAAFNIFQRVIKSRLARGEALGHDVLAYLKSKRAGADGEA